MLAYISDCNATLGPFIENFTVSRHLNFHMKYHKNVSCSDSFDESSFEISNGAIYQIIWVNFQMKFEMILLIWFHMRFQMKLHKYHSMNPSYVCAYEVIVGNIVKMSIQLIEWYCTYCLRIMLPLSSHSVLLLFIRQSNDYEQLYIAHVLIW